MSRPVHLILLLVLWIGPSLLIPDFSESIETPERSASGVASPKFGGVFRWMLGNNPSTLDPALLTDVYGRAVVSQLFDGLVQFDANLKPVPALAAFWEASRDARTWTFSLRQGVKFHHGREVTADDVVYSFTRLLSPQKATPTGDLFRHIQGANEFIDGKTAHVQGLRALDRYVFQMVLEEPLAPSLILLTLAHAAVVPREEVEKLGESFGRFPVGTGPFKFVRWRPNQEIVLEANDHYYEGRPFLDAAIFRIIVGSRWEETFAEFLEGKLEETIIPSGKIDEVLTNPTYRKYQRIRKPTLTLVYLGFNTQRKPFDDKRVRQAFTYAVNTHAVVREITKMGSLPAAGILPPGIPGYNANLQVYGYDPAKAKRLMAEAGYPDGSGFPVVQLWAGQKAKSTVAELTAYQNYLANLGVRVDIHYAPDWPTFKTMLEQGKLSMFRLAWHADIPDPDNFLTSLLHSSSPTNRTFYSNSYVDQLLESARTELHEEQRIALYRQVERLVLDDAPWIAQHHPVLEYLYQPYVQGVEVNLLGKRAIPLKKVWFKKGATERESGASTQFQPNR